MMVETRASLLDRYRILFDAAAIAAHARFGVQSFRQKDVRFLLELFANWLDRAVGGGGLLVQNTQVARYLNGLVSEGFARRVMSGTQPRYRLTRVGLLECLARMVRRSHGWPLEEFFFVYHFIESYQARIETLINQEGTRFPNALKVDIHALLDPSGLVDAQVRALSRAIEKLKLRVNDGHETSRLAKRLIQNGQAPQAIIEAIQLRYPYELNNQKPLSELFKETPEENWFWEMEVGAKKRAEQIFAPLLALLSTGLDQVRSRQRPLG